MFGEYHSALQLLTNLQQICIQYTISHYIMFGEYHSTQNSQHMHTAKLRISTKHLIKFGEYRKIYIYITAAYKQSYSLIIWRVRIISLEIHAINVQEYSKTILCITMQQTYQILLSSFTLQNFSSHSENSYTGVGILPLYKLCAYIYIGTQKQYI